ncbi:zinc finger protein 136 [Folsomia candida]|nr:zinc finger protein 136 [Folsomia candida]
MEEDGEGCFCTWHCSCKVLLGKRQFPEYLKLKEYQDFIKGPQTPQQSSSSSGSEKRQNRSDGTELVQANPKNIKDINKSDVPNCDLKLRTANCNSHLNEKNPNLLQEIASSDLSSSNNQQKSTNSEVYDVKEQTSENDMNGNSLNTTRSPASSTSGYNCRNRSRFFKCPTCRKAFGQLSSLQWHEKEHVLESSKHFQCEDCGKLYSTKASYERHLKNYHPSCLLCRKSMSLKEVENQPDEETGFNNINVCKKCRKIDAPVIIRRRSTAGESEFKIQSSATNGNGYAHPGQVSNEQCSNDEEGGAGEEDNHDDESENIYGTGDSTRHEEYDKPITFLQGINNPCDESILFCDYCGAMFDCSDDFLPHYNEHGKSEFECRYCLLPFSDSAQVMKHENTHQKERPFPCLMCPILFKSYHQREFHEMVHRNENCLLCSICGQAFTHHDRLKLHNQNIHHIHLELT